MIRRLFRAAVAAAVLSVPAVSAYAQTAQPLKPLSDADIAEGQALVEDYVTPIMNDANTAVTLATTDPARACSLAKTNEQRALVMNGKIKAMHDRLTAEGKTTEGFDEIERNSTQMVDGTHGTAMGLCNGGLTRTGDPAHDAPIDKMLGLSAKLTAAMAASVEADQRDDHTASCAHLRDADAAYTELFAYVRELRSKMHDGSAEAARTDAAIAKGATLKGQLTEELSTCPVASKP